LDFSGRGRNKFLGSKNTLKIELSDRLGIDAKGKKEIVVFSFLYF
jgi:hypothetical protein